MSAEAWTAVVLTLFPGMFPGPLGASIPGRAEAEGRWTLHTLNIRDFAVDKHRTVDDSPCGGGPGMVMRPDVVDAAIAGAREEHPGLPGIVLTPRGRLITQARVRELATGPGLLALCGRFEGIDQRVIDAHGLEELSLGDFVLSGGEPAAMALIDACVRLLPGVVGAPESLEEESFTEDLLEYPHYTKPQDWEGRTVPEVLLSGNHAKIRAWRREASERVTRERRPDLWARYTRDSANH